MGPFLIGYGGQKCGRGGVRWIKSTWTYLGQKHPVRGSFRVLYHKNFRIIIIIIFFLLMGCEKCSDSETGITWLSTELESETSRKKPRTNLVPRVGL